MNNFSLLSAFQPSNRLDVTLTDGLGYDSVVWGRKGVIWPLDFDALMGTCAWTNRFVVTANSTAAIEATNAIVQVGVFIGLDFFFLLSLALSLVVLASILSLFSCIGH